MVDVTYVVLEAKKIKEFLGQEMCQLVDMFWSHSQLQVVVHFTYTI
jgi:hypothetical protein